MLAAADCTNHYSEQIIYESEWTENIPTGISWLNLLTAQPIPEETDVIDNLRTPERNHSESNCSSTSVESCYVVLEIQRPRSIDGASIKHEEDVDEEEEEEETEEVIEELNFAQMHHDNHNVNYEQLAVSMTTETPMEEYVVENHHEQIVPAEEYAQVIEPIILETPNDILFHKAKTLSRFTKRMKAMSYLSAKEQQFSTSSDDESLTVTKLKTIRKINEYHSTTISAVAAEQQSTIQQSNSPRYSTTSLDSIENKSSPSSPIRTRITTTFSNLSSKRPLNPVQIQRPSPTMGTTTLTRTFAFDRACMEKYGRVREQINKPIEIQHKPVCETTIEEEIELPLKTIQQTESPSPLNDPLHCRSFINTIPTPFYIGSDPSTMDDSECEHHSSIPHSISVTNNLSKGSSILCSMKKYARTVTSEYRLTHTNENRFNEPTLLQVKYLDGRLPLQDDHARESFRKSHTVSGSISNRLNRLGLTKMASTQDLSFQTTSFNTSYRKRMLNRFRTFIENNSIESQPSPPQSRPWQHKTINELYSERKAKVNHQR